MSRGQVRKKLIGLNGRFSGTAKPTGTQIVAYQLYREIIKRERNFEILLFADLRFKDIADWGKEPGVTLIHVPFLDWSRTRSQLWEQFILMPRALLGGCQLVHSPISTSPVLKFGLKSAVTFHDFNFHIHPSWFSRGFRVFLEIAGVVSANRSDLVVTISKYVQTQAKQILKIHPSKVKVVYNGVGAIHATRENSGEKYILCVGSLQPHKNLKRCIQAYKTIKPNYPGLELRIVGRPQGNFSTIPGLEALLKTEGVQLLGYLDDVALASTYANASLFCYPSLEEGFGLPVLEAMKSKILVLTSNISCLPEISGGNAIYCDPYSIESISRGMDAALSMSEPESAAMIARGESWSNQFSWEQSAKDYIQLFEEVVHG